VEVLSAIEANIPPDIERCKLSMTWCVCGAAEPQDQGLAGFVEQPVEGGAADFALRQRRLYAFRERHASATSKLCPAALVRPGTIHSGTTEDRITPTP
jgi:hypothetical protein